MNVVIIGCGVVGAAVAYELCQVKGLKITVVDKQPPAQASTGAALGVLMGVISHKIKGNAWRMRHTSIQRYETLIPELEAKSGLHIPFNRQGILMLLLPSNPSLQGGQAPPNPPYEGGLEEISKWEKLVEVRQAQGLPLEIWSKAKLQQICPQIDDEEITSAVYSPSDRQVDPTALTLALVEAAKQQGVTFKFGVDVLGGVGDLLSRGVGEEGSRGEVNLTQVLSTEGKIAADWFVIAAGLGSHALTTQLNQIVDIRPVLGQALHLRLNYPLGNPDFQPVITGNDVHIVPVGGGNYWVGATVEFPSDTMEIPKDIQLLESVKQQALTYCPDLAFATTIRTWSGLRPRPEKRPAPIIDKLPGYNNVLLATGHYRNGVLLAPATAIAIREMISNNTN
ncbi:NAD(P)/FAD-dependent oxidoreductase [Iningainema tapete]|uniref:FAD-binding oxidoreductase n=1 Tax=Iningainema tapete BLCC-T55 TaxID=2748662 RepID=A0A8J6XH65_9CYAN|nr:FAD-dependent oxidoreductase [Iningainema tapete]MBD2774248.1 FAD-binding oxidoreductase [Iningainema tapete BLCC-T55]